jgi:hypothetical protein
MAGTDFLTARQRQVVNKRLTLNLLIQGAATHAHWTAHHLVFCELSRLDPELTEIYNEMMLRSRLGYWIGGIPSIMGNPIKFWWRLNDVGHEFQYHPFLAKHGFRIATETREDVFRKCSQEKIPVNAQLNEVCGIEVYRRAIQTEKPVLKQLVELAKSVCSKTWQIETGLLEAKLTQTPRFGTVREPETLEGKMILDCMIGWSAVVRREGKLKVKATATFWPMLVHELIKGTVELICLHGMNDVSDCEYEIALERTDHIEFEIPMLQIGGTIFRQFLLAKPREIPLAECVMHVARLEPQSLESFMFFLFESPNRATDMIRRSASGDEC